MPPLRLTQLTILGTLQPHSPPTHLPSTVVYWLEAPISPWGVLAFANIWFPLMFGSMLLGYAILRRDASVLWVADTRPQRSLLKRGSLMQLACLTGLANVLNGYGIIYASPPSRTPPLIQAVLQNSGIVFAVPFSILLLGDRKKYLAPVPVLAFLLIVASIVVSVLPTVLSGDASVGGGALTLGWASIYLVGIVPGALYNTIQQLFLLRSGALAPGVSKEQVTRATLRMLFWCNLWQAFWLVALFWLDILPWFGFSSSLEDFANNTRFSLSCSYAGAAGASGGDPASCTSQWGTSPQLWAFAFVIGYTVSYIGSAQLNRESATFNLIVAVITSSATAAIFLVPGLNPNASTTPLWSVLVSLLLSLSAMIMWKRWEMQTPAETQFAVAAAAPGEGKSGSGFTSLLSDEYADDAGDGFGSGYGTGYSGEGEDDSLYYNGGGMGARLGWQ